MKESLALLYVSSYTMIYQEVKYTSNLGLSYGNYDYNNIITSILKIVNIHNAQNYGENKLLTSARLHTDQTRAF